MRLRLFRKGGRRTRFAWLPKRLSNNTVVWLEWYQRYRLHEEPVEDDEPEDEFPHEPRQGAEPPDNTLARPPERGAPL